MTGDQFKRLIARLDLSQVGAARLMGYSPRQGQRWAVTGAPPAVAALLRAMLDEKLTADDIEKYCR